MSIAPSFFLLLPCKKKLLSFFLFYFLLVHVNFSYIDRYLTNSYIHIFPGKMSQHLDSLAIGDTIDAKGPVGHMHYLGLGRYLLDGSEHTVKRINMIAGGTGITPMYQVIKSVLKNSDDKTELALLYANQSPDDILLREELDALAADYPNFKVWYTVDKAEQDWAFSVGFINKEMIEKSLFPAAADAITCLCGPPPMIKFACIPNLVAVGFTEEQCIQF